MAVQIRTDTEANAAYISFRTVGPGQSAKQYPVYDAAGEVLAVLDFAADGELLGVELLDAEVQLPKDLPAR